MFTTISVRYRGEHPGLDDGLPSPRGWRRNGLEHWHVLSKIQRILLLRAEIFALGRRSVHIRQFRPRKVEMAAIFAISFFCRFEISARYRGSGLTETGTEIATIPARCKGHPSYIHSFGMSENFVVVPEQPLYLDDSVSSGCLPSSERFQKFRWKKGVPVSWKLLFKDQTSNTYIDVPHMVTFYTLRPLVHQQRVCAKLMKWIAS